MFNQRPGRAVSWPLPDNPVLQIISNKRLASYERLERNGGRLALNECVIVWAHRFLSGEKLYSETLDNLRNGVKYLFVLWEEEHPEFAKFVEQVRHAGVEPNGKLAVIFVDELLTLGNYVIINPDSEPKAFSAMIHDVLPFAWLEQGSGRAVRIVGEVKDLIKSLAANQRKYTYNLGSNSYPLSDKQLTNYSFVEHDFGKISVVFDKIVNFCPQESKAPASPVRYSDLFPLQP